MKKLISLILTLALFTAAMPVMAAESEIKTFDGVPYVVIGENLFESPNFIDASGNREAPGWYVGANTGEAWDGKAPDPKTGKNLTELESVVLGSENDAKGKEAFYYSQGGALSATGNDNFLCEYITKPAGSFWNGARALQAYVPIKPNTAYYFSYNVSSWGSKANASVRFGAIDSEKFTADSGDIIWSGSGGEHVGSFNGNNMTQRGSWAKKEGYIISGDTADYFFFNLYWLHDTNYICINGFTLEEMTPAKVLDIERPSVRVYAGDSPALPSRVKVSFEGGAEAALPALWDKLDTTRDGEYEAAGSVTVGADVYPITALVTVYSDSLSPDYTIVKSVTERNGEVAADFKVYTEKQESIMAALALYDDSGALTDVSVKSFVSGGSDEFTLSLPAPISDGCAVKTIVWNAEALAPLALSTEELVNIKEGGQFMSVSDVTLLDGMFKAAREVNEDYLMAIDPDRLLAPSLESAGLTPKADRYGGWEAANYNNQWGDKGISGHSLGHWLSAVSTASVESERYGDELTARLDYAVSELARVQEETGSGYIGGLNPAPFTEAFGGKINTPDGFNLNGGWVPWYSVHKIYQGLIDAYEVAGNKEALEVVKKFADWAVDGIENMTDEQMQKMLNVEYGGMNDVFAQLYSITGDERYLNAAVRFTHNSIIEPLAQGQDKLSGLHANTQIPKIVGAAATYGQDNSLTDLKDASEFFWDRVVNHRSFVIGGNSVSEHFEAEGAETLHIKDAETCNTFNMIKLTEHLFSWDHKGEYMDYVETALYNDILGSQDPDTGNKMYFTSMLQGHFRIYGTPDNSWWCCTGSGMENPGRYSKVIYYKDKDNMFVNLYIPSEVIWRETGLTLRMETNFPYSEDVTLTVTRGSGEAAVNFRVPSWLSGDMVIKINGEECDFEVQNGYAVLRRDWAEGDTVEINLPMALSIYTARDSESKVAFKYGPIVLAAPLGTELPGFDLRASETRVSELGLPANTVAVPSLKTESRDPYDFIDISDLSALTFSIDGKYTSSGQTIQLRPFYEIHHQFHNVYWYLNSEADPYDAALAEITIDSVIPDGQQEELGHRYEGVGSHNGSFVNGITTYYWRDAYGSADSYFSYDMKVDSVNKNYLYVSYWGSDGAFDNGGKHYTRSFDILVDGVKISSQSLNSESPNAPYNVFYDIPESITEGREKVTVKFAVQSASTCAGGVLDVRTTSKDHVDLE